MSCFLFYLFARIELATRGSKCVAFGRNSPGDCFAASALYFCADYAFLPVEQPECPASFFVHLQDLNLRHEAPNAKHLAETVRGTVSQRVPYISVIDYSFLPVEQPECPASFFVYLQDLNLRHEAPNAKHLAETVRGTVSQQVPCISVVGCLFSPAEQHFFSGVAVIGNARYKKAGQF